MSSSRRRNIRTCWASAQGRRSSRSARCRWRAGVTKSVISCSSGMRRPATPAAWSCWSSCAAVGTGSVMSCRWCTTTRGQAADPASANRTCVSQRASPTGIGRELRACRLAATSSGCRSTCTASGASSSGCQSGSVRQSLGSLMNHGRCMSRSRRIRPAVDAKRAASWSPSASGSKPRGLCHAAPAACSIESLSCTTSSRSQKPLGFSSFAPTARDSGAKWHPSRFRIRAAVDVPERCIPSTSSCTFCSPRLSGDSTMRLKHRD